MKKVLAIVLPLLIILSLVSAVSAAGTLSSNWKEAVPFTKQGHEPGFIDIGAAGEIVLDTTGGNNYLHSGIVYGEKVKVDGLTVDLEVDGLAVEIAGASAGYGFCILLSSGEIGDFAAYTDKNNIMTGNTMCPTCDTSKTAGYFFCLKDSDNFGVYGGNVSLNPVRYGAEIPAVPMDVPLHVVFSVEDGKIVTEINGNKFTAMNVDAEKVLDENGKAHFSVFNMGVGWAGAIVTVKSVNGVAANEWAGGEYVPAASSEVASSDPVSSVADSSETAAPSGCGNNA